MKDLVCVIRADASTAIGIGHVIRCRTLAQAMVAHGWQIFFAARETANLNPTLQAIGDVIAIPTHLDVLSEPRWLGEHLNNGVTVCITDNYAIDSVWQSSARAWASMIVAIDDLAAAPQDVDLLVNQNLGKTVEDYVGLVSDDAQLLVGPRYALVRPEFGWARHRLSPRTGRVRRALVFVSGADVPNVTARAAAACVQAGLAADVVVGSANPHLASLRRWAEGQPLVTVHHDTANMADLMSSADVAIGAGGSASWERCALGLPAVIIVMAENQVSIVDALVASGCAVSLGWHHQVDAAAVFKAIMALQSAPGLVMEMSDAASRVTDGLGVGRVVEAIETLVIAPPVVHQTHRISTAKRNNLTDGGSSPRGNSGADRNRLF